MGEERDENLCSVGPLASPSVPSPSLANEPATPLSEAQYAELGRACESHGLGWYVEDGSMRFQPPADLIEEQALERASLLAEGRGDKAYLMSAGPDRLRGGFEFVLRTPMGSAIAQWAFDCLDSIGAENWVETRFHHPERGGVMLTVQRERGETPGAKIKRLEALLEKASQSPVASDGEASNSGEADGGRPNPNLPPALLKGEPE